MKAGMLLGANQIEVRDVDVPTLRDQEVMLQPVRAGVCGSDVSLYRDTGSLRTSRSSSGTRSSRASSLWRPA